MEEKRYNTARPAAAAEGMGYRRISWGAILAGTVAALAVQLLFTLLGMAIGLWTLPAAGSEFMREIGIGAAIWAVVTFVIALYSGGWIAGRMSGLGSKFDGFLEGFMVWGLMTVITFMLLTTTVGNVVGGAAGLTGEILSQAGVEVRDPQRLVREFGAPTREALEDANVGERAEEVATGSAAASLGAFLSLLLGALSASFAGRQGSVSGLKEAIAAGGTGQGGTAGSRGKADVVE